MNFNAADLRITFDEIFIRRGGAPSGVLLTWAETLEGKFLSGIARFLDEPEDARATLDYRVVRLCETWLPLKDGLDRLMSILADKSEKESRTFGQFQQSLWGDRNLMEHHENFSHWPEWVLAARLDAAGAQLQVPSGAAVGHAMLPFDSYSRAIDWWHFGESVRARVGEDARHMRELLIVVPDTRGLLASVRWEGDKLSGNVLTRRSNADLELQVVLDTDEGKKLLEPLRPTPSAFMWNTPENARSAEVYLVHASGDLMGRSRVSPGASVTAEAQQLSDSAQAERDLSNGENDRVEFKPFVEWKDSKASEVLKSVVAFANTYGGRLYLGANDDGEPLGEEAFNRVLKDGSPDAAERYRRTIDKLVRERLKPTPLFNVKIVNVGDNPLLVIVVENGADKPYSTKEGNHVFIRKGASDMRPDPKTEMPRSADPGSSGLPPGFWNQG